MPSAHTKLIPNLFNKKNYVVHYRNLKYYIKQGLILTKIHRIIEFKQDNWMQKYILVEEGQFGVRKRLFQIL